MNQALGKDVFLVMETSPCATVEELNALLAPVVNMDTSIWRVTDHKALRDTLAVQLACSCIRGSAEVKAAACQAVWQICQFMGTPYATPELLLECAVRDGIVDMIVPIVDAEGIPFELLEIIMDAGNEMEVGTLLFRVNPGAGKQGVVCKVLCAALKQNWQAPVLFYDGTGELPLETVNLNWQKMLYFNSYDLPADQVKEVMGDLADVEFDALDAERWAALMQLPRAAWEGLWGDIYDVYCDLFEELDVNETFPLMKRYVIPKRVERIPESL